VTPAISLLLPAFLGATVEVAPGTDLTRALESSRPGDVIRLAAGPYTGSLGRVSTPLRIVGAGSGVTTVVAPEGEDGLVVENGQVSLSGLTIVASGPRAALKVLGGEVSAEGVAMVGGAVGVFVQGGRFTARDADLSGGYGLLLRNGSVALSGSRARGGHAGIAQLGGRSELVRVAIEGPSTEAGITVSGGSASLDDVVIRSPGPAGLSVAGSGRVEARALDVSGASEAEGGILGDCVQVRRGTLRLESAVLTRCGGAAVESLGGTLELMGVDATGGEAGCLVFLDRVRARVDGSRCTKHGPAVVAASGAEVMATMNHWLVDPILWVECASGARVHLGVGETAREPCQPSGVSLDKPR